MEMTYRMCSIPNQDGFVARPFWKRIHGVEWPYLDILRDAKEASLDTATVNISKIRVSYCSRETNWGLKWPNSRIICVL